MHWYIKCIKNYANFDGRAQRKEYWFFTLINMAILLFLWGVTKSNTLPSLYTVFILVPAIAVSWRRLHDTNKSGLFYFINFIPVVGNIIVIVFMCIKGTEGDNMYGEDPLLVQHTVL